MRLTKEQKQAYREYTINSIMHYENEKLRNRIKYLFHIFYKEQGWEINKMGEMKALANWLSGLPSVIHLPVYYGEQIELAKKFGSIPQKSTEKEELKIINNYYNFFANILIDLRNKENK